MYNGNDIVIEEMSTGCVITSKTGYVVISSIKDAEEVIKSLQDMINFLKNE